MASPSIYIHTQECIDCGLANLGKMHLGNSASDADCLALILVFRLDLGVLQMCLSVAKSFVAF